MNLSKDQKKITMGFISYIVAMILFNALLLICGNKEWSDIWPSGLGTLVGATVLYVFLIIGSKVPKKKDEDKE